MNYVKTHIEEFVENLYKSISIYSPKQLDTELVAGHLNIEVEYTDKASKCIDIGGIMIIRLNENLSKELQWQEFAHEVCHLLRHAGNQTTLSIPFIQLQEWQASTFAFHFCVPTFMLQELNLPFHRSSAILEVSKLFNVDFSFAAKRLRIYELQMMDVMTSESPSLD